MPKYHVVVLCSGPVGDAALTYRLTASSQQAAEFHACQMAGDHYRPREPARSCQVGEGQGIEVYHR